MQSLKKAEVIEYIKAIQDKNTVLKSKYDVDDFLSELSMQKSNTIRLIAWLQKTSCISMNEDTYAREILGLYVQYCKLYKDTMGDNFDKPVEALPKKSSIVLTADIYRSMNIFLSFMRELGIQDIDTNNVEQITYRVLALIHLTQKEYSYTQGYDRYFFVIYTLALLFVRKFHIPDDVAEGITFHLLIKFLKMADISSLLDGEGFAEKKYLKFDKQIKKHFPRVAQHYEEFGIGSQHFVLRWHILMFVDEHSYADILLLWDNILLHQADLSTYMDCLSLAHIGQVPVDPIEDLSASMQSYRGWNTIELIHTAEKLAPSIYEKHKDSIKNAMIGVSLFSIGILAYRLYRS